MRQILIYTIPALIVGTSVYAIPNPTPEELIEKENRQAIMDCVDSLSGTSLDIQKGTIECSKTPFRSITGTHSTGSSVPPSQGLNILSGKSLHVGKSEILVQEKQEQVEKLNKLHEKVCKKQINSPICKDRALFDRLYHLTEERLPNKQFFPILLGIVNAESSLGLNFAKDRVGGTCTGRNNWGGIKWKILDDGSRQFSNNNKFGYDYKKKGTDDYGCWLYPFDSIEDYWISKVNTFRFGYKACIDHKAPIWCISGPYVGARHVHEQSWINNVKIFLD